MSEPQDETRPNDAVVDDAGDDVGDAGEESPKGADYRQSFVALKDSVKQGRNIRKRERELKQLDARLSKDRLVHEDMANILENYEAVVGEQRRKLEVLKANAAHKQQQLDDTKEDLKRASDELEEVRGENRAALDALKESWSAKVETAEKAHAQAKEERRGMQAQLETAQEDSESNVELDLDTLQRKLDLARIREREAKDALDDAKGAMRRALRDRKQECEDREGPLAEQVDRLKADARRLDAEIEVGKEDQASVEKRIRYCDDIKEHPERADELAADIEQAEELAAEMRRQLAEMSEQHAAVKSSAGKAKRAVVLGVVVVVLVVVAIVLIVNSLQ